MNNLIDFFKKNFHILLFLLLQVICFVLIYNNINYPRFKLGRAARAITYPIHKSLGNIHAYFNLKTENQNLVEQNLEFLREEKRNFMWISDSLYSEEKENEKGGKNRLFDYTSANVVYNTTNMKYNYLILDKGATNGITLDMAVFSPQGVVGVVNDVSDRFATVMSVLHPDIRISARLMPTNQLGTVVWEDSDREMLSLHDIPQHIPVNIGDSVFTSGFSNVYPRDILIGTVKEATQNTNNSFLTIKLKLATDMNTISTVYIVKNLYKAELDQLKENFKHE